MVSSFIFQRYMYNNPQNFLPMKHFSKLLWIPIWFILFAGRSPETDKFSIVTPTYSAIASAHESPQPDLSAKLDTFASQTLELDTMASQTKITEETTHRLSKWQAPQHSKRRLLHLGLLGAIFVATLYVIIRWKQRFTYHNRGSREKPLKDVHRIAIILGMILILLIGGVWLSLLILGMPALMFGWALLGLLCVLGSLLILGLLLALLLDSTKTDDFFNSIFFLLIGIPMALFGGALLVDLFFSAFLGIALSFGIAFLLWLVFIAVGIAGLLLGVWLKNRIDD